jgi:hypothetical protein
MGAGSYRHMTLPSGRLRSNESFNGQIENGGDAYEAAEECYGMIWWLARSLAEKYGYTDRAAAARFVKEAQEHYQDGLRFGGVQRER